MKRFLIALLALCVVPISGSWAQNTPTLLNDCTVTSITTGGTSQIVLAANPRRQYLLIQNPSATASGVTAEAVYVNVDAAAVATSKSIELLNSAAPLIFDRPGFVPTGDINMIAATTNHKFICKWD